MKTILITGASSGIGLKTAEVFLEAGWTVGLVARRTEMLEALASRYDTAIALPGDVTDADQVEAVFDGFVEAAGRIDALFNNAGIFGQAGAVDEVTPAQFGEVVAVNLTAMFMVARAAFTRMKAQDPAGGRIINNGSIAAHSPRARAVSYTTTKHAITGLTKSISLDGRAQGIACGQIDIGNAETPMVERLNESLIAEGKDPNPVMEVGDAARLVLYMAELPLEANIQFATILATRMDYIGRG